MRRKRETPEQRFVVEKAVLDLLQGRRLEVEGPHKALPIVYLGSTAENRREQFWYEGPHGRTYKETPEEVVRAVLPHVGYRAIERAKRYARDTARDLKRAPITTSVETGRTLRQRKLLEDARRSVERGRTAEDQGDLASAAVWYRKAGAAFGSAGVMHRARYWTHRAEDLKTTRRMSHAKALEHLVGPRPKRRKRYYRQGRDLGSS